LARALCDRHFGIGADGLIRGRAGDPALGTSLTFELWNADGGMAEMSGNGMRCLAQAAASADLVPIGSPFLVGTAAGPKAVTIKPTEDPDEMWISVDMGPATVVDGDAEACNVDHGRMRVDMGNPHLVLLGPDPRTLPVERLGPELESAYPSGMNVEFVTLGPGQDEITIRVWERGVGETLACGTGACAAAAAVHAWGKVGTKVTVHQPGGAAAVDLSGGTVVLTGPSRCIASLEVPCH
jgi:diaminopimelate epimerase